MIANIFQHVYDITFMRTCSQYVKKKVLYMINNKFNKKKEENIQTLCIFKDNLCEKGYVHL